MPEQEKANTSHMYFIINANFFYLHLPRSPYICHIFAQVSVQCVELQLPTVATTHGAVLLQDLPAVVAKVVMAGKAGKAAMAVPRAQLHAVPAASPRGVDTWRSGHDQSVFTSSLGVKNCHLGVSKNMGKPQNGQNGW